MNRPVRIAITSGEPAGIGPDIVLLLLAQQQWPAAELVVIGDPQVMQARANQLGLSVEICEYQADATPSSPQAGKITVLPVACKADVQPGILNPDNAEYVLQTLREAAFGCLQDEFDAMVTAPLHKGVINDAGIPFTGHTEFLAELTEASLPVMMLTADTLRVALVTTHVPISKVSSLITAELLEEVLNILEHDLRQTFGISKPQILVCGLNPHAGENGHLGTEELETMIPVIQRLQKAGLNLHGPLPADTIFTDRHLQNADAVLAMYHDQGLPVLKHAGFGKAINITLGLPIIRTSVDHGTALELAGTGKANTGSLQAALELALQLAATKKGTPKDAQPLGGYNQ